MPASHTTVKHELLVRYLDAWAPAALHGHKRVTYLEGFADRCLAAESSAAAALRVFGEFADLLERHTLTMVLGGADAVRLPPCGATSTVSPRNTDHPAGLTYAWSPVLNSSYRS